MTVIGTINLSERLPENPTPVQSVAHHFALWWVRVFCDPQFDNGDTTRGGAMAQFFASAAAAETRVPASSLEKFYDDCVKCTTQALQETGRIDIDVDYHPDEILRGLMMGAGIPHGLAPWKTNTVAALKYRGHELGVVATSYGYGAPTVIVYDGANPN